MKKILSIILVFIVSFLISCTKNVEYIGKTLFLFDTIININFYNEDDSEKHYENIKELLTEISKISSNFDSYDNKSIYDLNINRTIPYNEDLDEMLNYALSAKKYTLDYFNPLIGKITNLWKDALKNQTLPSDDLIKEELKIMNNSYINITNNEISIIGDANVDLGGFIKGYACFKLLDYVKQNDIKNFLFNLGESNILFGKKVKTDFSFGLKNPTSDGYYAQGKISNIILSTSSVEYQNFEIDGKIYNHIINPFTGYPTNYYDSVNVFLKYSDNIIDCFTDALSTAIFVMPKDIAIEYAKNNNLGIILYKDKILYKSDELDYVKEI